MGDSIPSFIPHRRRGVTAVMTAVLMVVLLGFAALTVDLGMVYNVRSDLQRSADASALAGAWRLLDDARLKGDAYQTSVFEAARTTVNSTAASNAVFTTHADIQPDPASIGYLSDPTSSVESFSFADPDRYNSVAVQVRRDGSNNGPVQLWFSRIFGREDTGVTATATATFWDGVDGFRVTDQTGNSGLLPLTLRVNVWNNLLQGIGSTGDNYAYDPATGTVSPGSDGISEINLYPGAGAGQLPPGNFGTVDIGNPNNSTADLSRQIREGVNQSDLAYFGGSLELGSDGTLQLNGDTGLSAGIKDDLESIKGLPRTIPLFSTVSGPGNNSMFTVVGFAGIRIMNVQLTGSMNSKNVIIQPAYVVDDTVIAGPSTGSSHFVYQPPRLTR